MFNFEIISGQVFTIKTWRHYDAFFRMDSAFEYDEHDEKEYFDRVTNYTCGHGTLLCSYVKPVLSGAQVISWERINKDEHHKFTDDIEIEIRLHSILRLPNPNYILNVVKPYSSYGEIFRTDFPNKYSGASVFQENIEVVGHDRDFLLSRVEHLKEELESEVKRRIKEYEHLQEFATQPMLSEEAIKYLIKNHII